MMARSRVLEPTTLIPLVIVLSTTLIFMLAGCGQHSVRVNDRDTIVSHADHDVNQFILDRLSRNRIVMIGDFGHSLYLYKRPVKELLQSWLDQLEAGDSTAPSKLLLVLEMDSVRASRIESASVLYRPEDCLDDVALFSEQFTVGTFQFYYHDLRKILQRIAKYNATCTSSDSVYLAILGPERTIDPHDWSFARRDSFYVYERDSCSAHRIIEFLDNDSTYRALVFYGGTHMLRHKTLKQAGDFKDSGFYLAHYLTSYFRNSGGVYSIYQSYALKPDLRKWEFMTAPGSTYAIENQYLDFNIQSSDLQTTFDIHSYDGSIIHFDKPARGTPLLLVWSRNVLNHIVAHLTQYESSDNDFAKIKWRLADRYLRMISGEEYRLDDSSGRWRPQTAEEWTEWARSSGIDVVSDIRSLAIWRRLIDRMAAAQGRYVNWYENLLAESLRMHPLYDTLLSSLERVQVYRDHLGEKRDSIVIANLVQLVCIGTDAEVEQAVPVLQHLTGLDFHNPDEWRDWWRIHKEDR